MKALNYKVVVFTLGIIAIVLIGGFWIWGEMKNEQAMPNRQNEGTLTPPNNRNTPGTNQPSGNVKNITINSQAIGYDLKEIRVKQGDRVRLTFNNTGGFHDWVVDEFNARTPKINANETTTVEFTADKKGTFEYYCSVGNHRQMGMKGNLIVE